MIQPDLKFERDVAEAARLATRHAVESLNVKSRDDIAKLPRSDFVAKCHEGFSLAQDIALKNVLALEPELRAIRQKRTAYEKGKKKGELKDDANYAALRAEEDRLSTGIRLFQRLVDAIAWQILGMNSVLIRSTVTGQEGGYLTDKNLTSVLRVIAERKAAGEFMLINDLTSCLGAGSGDLIHVHIDQRLTFLEVKEGEEN
jgi:hypothetical protein